MTYPLVQFVSAPEVGATVRFDFNASLGVDVESFPEHEGFSLGAPEMIGNPGEYGTSWGDRELTLTAFIEGSRSAAYTAQTTLARELWRRENWLLFQLDATSPPRWFRTYRSPAGALGFEHIYTDREPDLWGIPITLSAEAFAYGPKETVGPVTITNNPAAGTNPMRYTLPTVKGDAPAPLRVDIAPSAAISGKNFLTAISEDAPTILQTSTATAGTDTGDEVAIAGFSGDTGRKVTFATFPGLMIRATWSPTVKPGRYRLLMRTARSDTSTTYSARVEVGQSGGYATEAVAMTLGATSAAGHAQWLDFGAVTLPTNAPNIPDLLPSATQIKLLVERLSGTGEVWLDALMLLPVADEGNVGIRSENLFSGSGETVRWDGDHEAFYMLTSTGALSGLGAALLEGGFLEAFPGRANVLTLLQTVDFVATSTALEGISDSITATAQLSVSYHPRYLWIGGA